MVVVGQSSVEKTFLQAVNSIIRKVGENQAATLSNPSRHINIAMDAVEEARDEIWKHTKWDFRRGFFDIELVDETMWYDLPGDFAGMASKLSLNRKTEGVVYKNYEDMMDLVPELRSFPPGSGIGGLDSATQLALQTTNFGESLYYTTWGGYIGLMPIPDEAFVELEERIYASYWKSAPNLSQDSDVMGLPRNLWNALTFLSLGRLKKALEYGDWKDDITLGTFDMKREANGGLDPQEENVYHEGQANYNE